MDAKVRWLRAGRGFALVAAVFLAGCSRLSISFGESVGVGSEKATREDVLALDLKEGETLEFSGRTASIEVEARAGAKPEVRATFTAHADDRETAEQILARYSLVAERTGSGLRLRVEGEPLEAKSGISTRRLAASAACKVAAPAGTALRAKTESGSIEARGSLGSCEARTSFGGVKVEGARGGVLAESKSGAIAVAAARGGSVVVKSDFGAVSVKDVEAERVEARSASGAVEVEEARAGRIEVESGFGRLRIARVAGEIAAKTSSGAVDLEEAAEGKADLSSGFGAVTVRGAAGTLRAKSQSGAVTVEGFRGEVAAESGFGSVGLRGVFSKVAATSGSGKVEVRAERGSAPSSGWRLASGFGSLLLEAPADFACRLEAKTSFGSIECDFPVTTEAGWNSTKKELVGTVNGGGETVALDAKSGSIAVRKAGA
ncbi:MAG TPA: DUF4097 family beta strand repeat-containing protein [Planctomycetota bacterium]|jgi:DUF4097 and DUF4098 domain-containing protein YvlB|nr:DUF4097 family beta strand repeat-containing protein [Planctomycetota bacterium]